MLAGFVAGALILLATLLGAWIAAQQFIGSTRLARQSIEITVACDQLRAALGELMESHFAFLATGDDAWQKARARAAEQIDTFANRLLQRIPQDAERRVRAEQMTQEIRAHVAATLSSSVASPDDWRRLRDRTTEVRATLESVRSTEAALYVFHALEARDHNFWVYATVVVAGIAMVGVLGGLLWRIRGELRMRQTIESDLQTANRLLESLVENIPAMVFAKDARDLRFIRINRKGEELLGLQRDQLIGKTDRDFFPADQAEHFINKDRETLDQGRILEIPDEEIDSRIRGRRTLHTFKVPIHGERGKPALLLGISLDITEQKAAQRRIEALNEELMRQAQLLQSSNQELESFCYSVSHDLRAPLRAINGYARLLEQDYGTRFDAEGQRFLRTICTACERMARLIDDLLEFSRLGRQTLQLEPLDMDSMVSKVIGVAVEGRDQPAPAIDARPLPPVQGDRNLLHLVWLNLIDNAVKYTTGVDDPRIEIGAEVANGEVVYSVKDNGIGFDMRYADKLFGVFQRLHADARFPGTGVGLAIAQRIVARHGGRIWARSEPGHGSTFSFAMPLAAQDAVAEAG